VPIRQPLVEQLRERGRAEKYHDRAWLGGLRVTLLVRLAGVQEQSGDVSVAIETLQQTMASDAVHEEAQGC
jgi:ABC-type cobalamin transport system ATPase subunit